MSLEDLDKIASIPFSGEFDGAGKTFFLFFDGFGENAFCRLKSGINVRMTFASTLGDIPEASSMSILDRHIDLTVGCERERDEMLDKIEDDGSICVEFTGIDGVIEEDVALETIAIGDVVEDLLDMTHEACVPEASLEL